ncbi:hypothetical protein MRX96_013785 [Rhipicephalus microplus]
MSGQPDARGGARIFRPKYIPQVRRRLGDAVDVKRQFREKVSTAIGSSDIEGTVVHMRFMLIRGKTEAQDATLPTAKKARQRTVRHKYSKRDETVDELGVRHQNQEWPPWAK